MAITETSPTDLTAPLVREASPVAVRGAHAAGSLLAARVLGERGFVAACLAVDLAALAIAMVAVDGPAALTGMAAVVTAAITIVALAWRGLYDGEGRGSAPDLLAPVTIAVAVAALAAAQLEALLPGDRGGDGLDVVVVALAIAGIAFGRAILLTLRRHVRACGAIARPTLILGAGEVGDRIARRLLADPGLGLRPIGFVDGPSERGGPAGDAALPVLGSTDELPALAAATGARELIVAFPGDACDAEVRPTVARCERLGLRVSIVPRLFEAVNGSVAYEPLAGLPMLRLRPVDPDGWRFAVKHGFDRAAAAVGLVLLAPVLLGIALAVRLESPGPALFRQRRVGRDGQVFDLLKFRSMRVTPTTEAFVPVGGRAPGGVEGDDRRTPTGRFLRRTSLDELPQLVNVLRGQMSLVGPRPERPEYVEVFHREIRRYGDRQRVRSGVTGWAQIHDLRGQTSLADRVEWDNFYIEHWSLGLDLKILLRTFAAVFRSVEE